MTSSRNLSDYGRYPLPTDTTKKYNIQPGSGWVEAVSGGGSTVQVMHVVDQKATGTGGGVSESLSWVGRDLNTVLLNQIAGASLSGNAVTLPPGNYYVMGSSVFTSSSPTIVRVFNATDSTVAAGGLNGNGVSNTTITANGGFTITANKSFSLQYNGGNGGGGSGSGLGSAKGFTGTPERYSELIIWKLS